MLPKAANARMSGRWDRTIFKVAGLSDLFDPPAPFDRMVLDLRDPFTRTLAIDSIGNWGGVLVDDVESVLPNAAIAIDGNPEIVQPGDVIEVRGDRAKVSVLYRRGDNANILFTTERCNSYCLMCSQPPRVVDDDWRVDGLCELINLIDKDEHLLTITGGEPTLLGAGLHRVVTYCAENLPETRIHILSNGRILANDGYARSFMGTHHLLSWGVPLYGDTYELHDYVVQRAGAFAETMRGLYALHGAGQVIELRVVLVTPTVQRLEELARYICRNLPFVDHVALMGVEPTGFAKAHHEELWVDPVDMSDALFAAVDLLRGNSIRVSLYNLPLCALPCSLWRYAHRSISNWKQDYLTACQKCSIREQCGGFFAWVTPKWTSRAITPITVEALS